VPQEPHQREPAVVSGPVRRTDGESITQAEPPSKREQKFFAGPQSRGFELWFVIRIALEFIRGFRALHFVGPCVTVFGSARFAEGHRYYELARATGAELARAGFAVMTGGGPGVMEAANRGAKEAGGRSVGSNIVLPLEQRANRYLDVFVTFRHFFVRKVMLVKYSYAFIALPGGFGTFDEVFEAATLIQTDKIRDFPIILIGRDYWQPIIDVTLGTMVREGTIAPEDAEMLRVTDSIEEAVSYVRDVAITKFGLKYGKPVRRRWWFFE
jgi:uncharacterized protein (TIGR00730 family)